MATQAPAARPRPGGGRLFIIVGLLLAVLAGAGVFVLGNVLGNGGGGGGSQTNVVIARQTINLRHRITKDDLTTVKGSGTFLTNAYQNTGDVVNLIAQVNIHQGAIITSDMLASNLSLANASSIQPEYLPLAAGYVAMTVPTSEQQGVAGHINVGDYITVIASTNVSIFATTGQQGAPKVVSKTVFRQIHVIGIGPAVNNTVPASGSTAQANQQPTGGVTSSLTIELTQCDAEFMTWFLNNTQLRYTLEAQEDYLKAPPSVPDTKCPSIDSAQGVSNTTVNNAFHFTSA